VFLGRESPSKRPPALAIPLPLIHPQGVKKIIWLFVLIGSSAGGYVPTLFGAGFMSLSSLLGGVLGGAVGVAAGYGLGRRLGL
jgi:hypothetical protein